MLYIRIRVHARARKNTESPNRRSQAKCTYFSLCRPSFDTKRTQYVQNYPYSYTLLYHAFSLLSIPTNKASLMGTRVLRPFLFNYSIILYAILAKISTVLFESDTKIARFVNLINILTCFQERFRLKTKVFRNMFNLIKQKSCIFRGLYRLFIATAVLCKNHKIDTVFSTNVHSAQCTQTGVLWHRDFFPVYSTFL